MLEIINSLDHSLINYLRQDPVRPYIGLEFRVGHSQESFALLSESREVRSIICCAYRSHVPRSLDQLLADNSLSLPTVAVFYTVWSYSSGAGRSIILEVRDWIRSRRPFIQQFVTFSPQGESVRQFHLSNGAKVINVNEDSINYEY